MKKEKKSHHFIVKPYYPGGNKELSKFIYGTMVYPKEAISNNISGVVIIKIDIDHKGKVFGSKIIQSLGYGCDQEATRIVKLIQFKLDQVVRKGRTIFHRTLNIHFRLPKVKKESPKISTIQYKVIKKEASGHQPKSSSYSYSIPWND